jgi:hypothetical protein
VTALSLLCRAIRDDWPLWSAIFAGFAVWLYCLIKVRRFRP